LPFPPPHPTHVGSGRMSTNTVPIIDYGMKEYQYIVGYARVLLMRRRSAPEKIYYSFLIFLGQSCETPLLPHPPANAAAILLHLLLPAPPHSPQPDKTVEPFFPARPKTVHFVLSIVSSRCFFHCHLPYLPRICSRF
jgi:hypothetical protein